MIDMSIHAKERSSQRGIPRPVIDLTVRYGTPRTRADGTLEYEIRPRDRVRAQKHLKQKLQRLDKAAGKIVILGEDDTVVTAYRSE